MSRERTAAVAVVEVGLFVAVLGLPDGGLGVLWPSMRASLGRPVGDLGVLALAGTIPYLLAGVLSGRTVRRLGYGSVAILVGLVAAFASAVWSVAAAWWVVVGAVALLGWSRGATDSALNAYASEHQGVRRLGVLHASYGVGATAAPLAIATVLALGGGWRAAIAGVAILSAGIGVVSWVARSHWRAPGSGAGAEAAGSVADVRAVVAGVLLVFFVYVAAEAATGAWAFTVLTGPRGMARVAAGAVVASYWAALTLGRVALAVHGAAARRMAIVSLGSLVALVALAFFAADPLGAGWIGLPVAGLAFGPIFPVLISLIPEWVGAQRSAPVIGWSVSAAALGGPVAIAAAGLVADRTAVDRVPIVLVLAAAALVVAHRWAVRLTRPRSLL